MLQPLWALMTWRQRIQMEASVWALTKKLDTRLQAGSVPSLLIYSYSWWVLVIVRSWPCWAQSIKIFIFFFTIGCCKLSVNQTVIGRISPLLSGPVSFAVADVAENRQDVNSSPQGVSNASPILFSPFRFLSLPPLNITVSFCLSPVFFFGSFSLFCNLPQRLANRGDTFTLWLGDICKQWLRQSANEKTQTLCPLVVSLVI